MWTVGLTVETKLSFVVISPPLIVDACSLTYGLLHRIIDFLVACKIAVNYRFPLNSAVHIQSLVGFDIKFLAHFRTKRSGGKTPGACHFFSFFF